jgi:hypothetical protein
VVRTPGGDGVSDYYSCDKDFAALSAIIEIGCQQVGGKLVQSDGAIDCAYQQEYYHYANTSSIPDAYYYFQNAPSCLSQCFTLQYSGDYQQSTSPASPPDKYDDGEEEGVYSGRPWTLVIVLLASAVGLLILIAVVVWRSPHRTTTITGTGAKGVESPVLVPVPEQQQQQQQSPPKE